MADPDLGHGRLVEQPQERVTPVAVEEGVLPYGVLLQ